MKVCAITTAVLLNAMLMSEACKQRPINPSRPNALEQRNATNHGGNTSGSRISSRSNRTSRAAQRASISYGHPSSTHSTVLVTTVSRLSNSAVFDKKLVINDQKFWLVHLDRYRQQEQCHKDGPRCGGDICTTGTSVHFGRQSLTKPDWARIC